MDRGESSSHGRTGDTEVRALRGYLRALGDTVRLQLMRQLAAEGEMNVMDLAHALRISQPLVSWHLGVLRRAELVAMRRQGREVWYSLDRSALRAYRARLDVWLGYPGDDELDEENADA
jgi:DNA-binding transcriptional ArsR family regulator